MHFLYINKKWITLIYIFSILLEFFIAFLINLISNVPFSFFSVENIILYTIFTISTIIFVVLKIKIKTSSSKVNAHRLQKAFKEQGGYEFVVEEMKRSIERHDYKEIRQLKKVVDIIEK